MKRKKNQLHFNIITRKQIEDYLNEGMSITQISNYISKDRSNIAREINKHKKISYPSSFNNTWYCLNAPSCNRKIFDCEKSCSKFLPDICERLSKSPHVCNGCEKIRKCRKLKYLYDAEFANNQYLTLLNQSRTKMHYTDLELSILNNDFKNLVFQTRSIYHSLIVIDKRGFNFKKSSIYRQIKEGRLPIKAGDLPRYIPSKFHEKTDNSYKRNIDGHTYEDYTEYIKNNQQAIICEMDTVEGIKEPNAPVLFTFEIISVKFLFAFLITAQTIDKVIKKLLYLKNIIGDDIWKLISEVILTDNGKEFYNYEKFQDTFPASNIFYCHPYSSFEKGSIENSHELIRRVIPKGISLKPYSQKDINLLVNHINSLYRESLKGKCPFDLINKIIPEKIITQLGLSKINAENVNLTPKLLGENNIKNIKKYLDYNEIKKSHINLK